MQQARLVWHCRHFPPLRIQRIQSADSLTPHPVAETERVVVTGTYIPIPTAESEGALPVVGYSREQLIEFGANTPAEGLRQYLGDALSLGFIGYHTHLTSDYSKPYNERRLNDRQTERPLTLTNQFLSRSERSRRASQP